MRCWDMTHLPAKVMEQWFYAYLILDVCSRKIVRFEMCQTDCSDQAVDLLQRTALAEGVHSLLQKPVLHGGILRPATFFGSSSSTAAIC